ncbi:MAG: RNA-binding domain-containing protein [Candidatus Helarchaeota archaeon]
MKVNNISFELFSHATEDVEKVKKCMINAVPLNLQDKIEGKIKSEVLEGHYKEPIILLESNLKNKDAEVVFDNLMRNLNKKLSVKDFLKRYDESKGFFYLRINKQACFKLNSKFLLLDKGDVIKIRVHFQGFPLKTNVLIGYLRENEYIID